MTSVIAATVLIATALQAWSATVELGRVKENREAIETWDTEDALAAEHPRLRRRRIRRQLRELRGPELHREIRRIQLTLASWVMLLSAAAWVLIEALRS